MNTPTDKLEGMKVSVNHTCFLNVLSHEQPSSLWPVPPISVRVGPWVCSKQFSPAALARGLFMRVNIVKADTSILFYFVEFLMQGVCIETWSSTCRDLNLCNIHPQHGYEPQFITSNSATCQIAQNL